MEAAAERPLELSAAELEELWAQSKRSEAEQRR